MPLKIIVVGAGGFGREIIDYINDITKINPNIILTGLLDDDPNKLTPWQDRIPLLTTITAYQAEADHHLVLAIGHPEVRQQITTRLQPHKVRYYTLIHPLAYVSSQASLGEGCVICPFAFIGANATLGDQVVVNNFASCSHDSVAENFSVLSPYAALNGGAKLGTGAFLGSHAHVNPMRSVGMWSTIGSGASVVKDIGPHTTAYGVPAKPRNN